MEHLRTTQICLHVTDLLRDFVPLSEGQEGYTRMSFFSDGPKGV